MSVINRFKTAFLIFTSLTLLACSGGGGGGGGRGGGADTANFGCDGGCANKALSIEVVTRILSQSIAGAEHFGVSATIAVVDRVGNVLALYEMDGATAITTINGQIGGAGGLEGASVPSTLAAVSKAGTGAYLSSQGNSFTSRTASQIVQEHFNPGEEGQPGGPLFGVQFSQLICSDVTIKGATSAGPKPLPLGLSADAGGLPLYKEGDLVGGIGVEFDGLYSFDRDLQDSDINKEEIIALIGSIGFEAPSERAASRIFVGGKSLRYADTDYADLPTLPETLPEIDSSKLRTVAVFGSSRIIGGVPFGSAGSGIMNTTRAGLPAGILTDSAGNPRFPSRSGSSLNGAQLTGSEVEALLDSALLTAFRARAAIRTPQDTPARVSIFVIDHLGIPLGFVRSQDAPIFGIDVSLQKARTAALFSSQDAAATLSRGGLGGYVTGATTFAGREILGAFAFSNRAVGNLARPLFPDGIDGNSNGPLSHPLPGIGAGAAWSPFNTGLQLDLIFTGIVQPLQGIIPSNCANGGVFGRRAQNGIQIFPGSVPLYRGHTLIGAIGVSGDGIDQDDLVAFYGASRKGLDTSGHTDIGDPVLGFNAPSDMRADSILFPLENTRLRYVNCPEAPFIGSDEQNVCDQ